MKKKIILLLIVNLIILSFMVSAIDGTGFEFDPYVLSNCDELNNLSINTTGYYILGNDIDCSGYVWNNGNVPLGANFGGTFDGQNFSIVNFSHYGANPLFSAPVGNFLNTFWINPKFGFNATASQDVNFFSYSSNGALYKNIHIVNGDLSCGGGYCTSLNWFGDEFYGNSLIDGCSVSGNISGNGHLSSFIHQDSADTIVINNSFSSANIKLHDSYSSTLLQDVGGLVGRRGGIQNSYFNGTIERINGTLNYFGGVCGRNLGEIVKNTYISAKFINITFGGSTGLFIGTCVNAFTDNHVDNETGGSNYLGSGCGVGIELNNVSEMQSKSTFTNWDFNNTWLIDERNDFPKLKWQYPEPVIYGFSVENPDNDNFVLSNNSVFEYLSGDWCISYGINTSSYILNNINNVSNISETIYFNESNYIHPIDIDSSLIEDANPHLFHISMSDAFYNSTETIYFTIDDTILPNCLGLVNKSLLINTTYDISIFCSDESLNSFNLTCGNLYQYFNNSMDTENLTITDSFILTETTECFYEYCDKFDNCVSDSYIITATSSQEGNGEMELTGIAEVLMIGIIIMLLCFMMVVGLWKKIPAVVFITGIIFLFVGLFIQTLNLSGWITIIGVGMLSWALIMIAVSFGLAKK